MSRSLLADLHTLKAISRWIAYTGHSNLEAGNSKFLPVHVVFHNCLLWFKKKSLILPRFCNNRKSSAELGSSGDDCSMWLELTVVTRLLRFHNKPFWKQASSFLMGQGLWNNSQFNRDRPALEKVSVLFVGSVVCMHATSDPCVVTHVPCVAVKVNFLFVSVWLWVMDVSIDVVWIVSWRTAC